MCVCTDSVSLAPWLASCSTNEILFSIRSSTDGFGGISWKVELEGDGAARG